LIRRCVDFSKEQFFSSSANLFPLGKFISFTLWGEAKITKLQSFSYLLGLQQVEKKLDGLPGYVARSIVWCFFFPRHVSL
jgi:hypothetical protein